MGNNVDVALKGLAHLANYRRTYQFKKTTNLKLIMERDEGIDAPLPTICHLGFICFIIKLVFLKDLYLDI